MNESLIKVNPITSDQIKYLQSMKKNEVLLNQIIKQKVQEVLKNKQCELKEKIQKGDLSMEDQNPQNQINLNSKSQSSNRANEKYKQPFYISSNPEIIKQNYEKFQALKKDYSHENTSQVVKQVESKIRGWMKGQKSSSEKRLRYIQQKMIEQKFKKQNQQQEKRKSLQIKKQELRENILSKIEERTNQKKYLQISRLKQNISKKILKSKTPLYIEKEKQHQEMQRQILLFNKIKTKASKKQSISLNSQSYKNHEKRYMEEIKQRISSKQKDDQSRKIKTEMQPMHHPKKQFITTFRNRQQDQFIEQMKRVRIREYVDRLKAMSPDFTTLERIQKVRQQILESEKILQKSRKQKSRLKKRASSSSGKQFSKNIDDIDRKKFGNNYLKHLKYLKVKTQNVEIKEKTEENIEENSSKTIERRLNTEVQMGKSSFKQIPLFQSKLLQSKLSLKKSKVTAKKLSKQNNHQQLLPSIEKRPQYKNYLSQLKLKPAKPQSQIQKMKKILKYPTQIMREFNKKSIQIEKQMLIKIKDFKKQQKSQKYQKSLQKELQIDDLYHRNLQLRLACLQLS